MSEIVTTGAITLDTLADSIRRHVEASDVDFRRAVDHAIRAGELLIEAKAAIGHGGWLPWLEANFPKSPRSAQGYMRLAEHPEDAQRVAHLGIKGALKQLAPPEIEPKSEIETDPEPDRSDRRVPKKTTMCTRCECRVRTDRPHKCPATRRLLDEAYKALKGAYADASGYPGAVADLPECLDLAERCARLAGKVRAEVGGRFLDEDGHR
jgi:hypothetical protein